MLLSLVSLYKNIIVTTIRRDVALTVFSESINQSYQQILSTKTSEMMNNITAGISHLSNGILYSAVNILIETFTIIAVCVV